MPGVECASDGIYHRTVRIGEHRGWLSVAPVVGRNLLAVDLAATLAPALPSVLVRLRNLFDLDARPDVIAGHLALDPRLAPWVDRRPGLRVPGAFEPFEFCLRAILGQQISVRGATTLSGRVAQRFGEPIETPFPCLNRLAPTAESLARSTRDELAGLGLPGARAECVRNLAGVVARGEIDLRPSVDPNAVVARLVRLPGIGSWTAEYIAMRCLRWPDAFPAGDLVLRKAMGMISAKALEKESERWRPWRAYAALHLWESLNAIPDSE